MTTNKLFIWTFIFALTVNSVFASYNELSCDSDPAFKANSCNQCFDWGQKWAWESFGLLSDLYVNKSSSDRLLYKEEQNFPTLVNLAWDKTLWSQTPSSENFWEYTPEFEALYSKDQEAYVVKANSNITWLKSKLGYAYKLDKNTANKWENIGLLIYPVTSHTISGSGEVSVDADEHKECVLFKAWNAVAKVTPTVVENVKPKALPKTWPESILLVFFAMILWIGFYGLKRKSF